MDNETARALSALTTDFYRRTSASFDATRQTPWPGWERVAELAGARPGVRMGVLDLACGNLRFVRFLEGRGCVVQAWAYDSCDELVGAGAGALGPACTLHLRHLDVAEALWRGTLVGALEAPPLDLAVCFGFLHHVPLARQRAQVLDALVGCVRPGGTVAVSLWQLERSARLMAKARPAPGGDVGDYLLGWQDEPDVARYCHSFSEAEVDELSASCAPRATEVARFSADGRTGDLNRYLVLRRR